MKLYYSSLACSLADHIALFEAGVAFDSERVDLRTRRTASGGDLAEVTAKPYVPVLVLRSTRSLSKATPASNRAMWSARLQASEL